MSMIRYVAPIVVNMQPDSMIDPIIDSSIMTSLSFPSKGTENPHIARQISEVHLSRRMPMILYDIFQLISLPSISGCERFVETVKFMMMKMDR